MRAAFVSRRVASRSGRIAAPRRARLSTDPYAYGQKYAKSTDLNLSLFARGQNAFDAAGGALTLAGSAFIGYYLYQALTFSPADDEVLHPPAMPWDHKGHFKTYDVASLRRGHHVYRQVCSVCHSLERIAYRNLVDVMFSVDEVKEMMADSPEVIDGPDETGEMFERTAKLSDYLPSPYRNEEEARMANAGAYPPDLSLITKARHGGDDYIFSLLLGYRDVPEGVQLREGLYYNQYFPGGAIGMPKQLEDGMVEYEDGTPATETQMAKDVSHFLAWAAEPEHDERKLMGVKWISGLTALALITGWRKRMVWSVIKSKKISYQ